MKKDIKVPIRPCVESLDDLIPCGDAQNKVIDIPLGELASFKGHMFKPYENQRLDEMTASIRANGVMLPIIVRPISESGYEILSGHNRVKAARIVELETIPAIVHQGLTDEEALIIVMDTNLLQRSFTDLTHSERAAALTVRHNAIKQQGRRSDMIKEVESMVNANNDGDSNTSGEACQKSDSRAIAGEQFDLSSRTVADYLRINMLVQPLKAMLDDDVKFGMQAAVKLSYIPETEQLIVADVLDAYNCKLVTDKAQALRLASKKKPLSPDTVKSILNGFKSSKLSGSGTIKLNAQIMTQYFRPEQKPKEIAAIIAKALEFYYASQAESP